MDRWWRCAYLADHSTGVRAVITFHVGSTQDFGSLGIADAAAVRDALDGALTAKYRALLTTAWTLQSLVVREELPPGSTDVPREASKTIGLAGTTGGGSDMLPVPTCLLTTFYTDAAIRSGHGRMFLPAAVSATGLTGAGLWETTSTWYGLTKTFLDELVSTHSVDDGASGTNTLHPIVYSRTRRAIPGAAFAFFITSYTRRLQPHWLRSRMTSP